ncbi:hypothetical protein R0135_15610 [Congregibacter variabilis]|uniref:Secreted protein n=1 Tax=Congregibacter variabilis TaxID=3081200 RepID=A0ABZ0I3U1_9GAMM|nr:hypothetical protein R0135_15610 [Congregibacter sp. IMCC43200]
MINQGAFKLILLLMTLASFSQQVLAQPPDQDFESAPAGVQANPYALGQIVYSATYATADTLFVHDADIGVFLSPNFLSLAANFGAASEVRISSVGGAEFKFSGMDVSFGSCVGCGGTYELTPYRDGVAVAGGVQTITWPDITGPAAAFDVSAQTTWENIDEIRVNKTVGSFYFAIDNLNFEPAVDPSMAVAAQGVPALPVPALLILLVLLVGAAVGYGRDAIRS